MNTEKYLPIGTVCILKNAAKRVMITGYAVKGKESGDKVYDYVGCLYPEGVVNSNQNLLFDHVQIDKIFYMGYIDEEQKELMIKLKEFINNNNMNLGNNNVVNQTQTIADGNSVNNQPLPQMATRNQDSINNVQSLDQQNMFNPANGVFNSIPSQN